MSARVRVKREDKIPPAPTILGALDLSTKRTMARARTMATSSIQALLPTGRTGNLRRATRAKVRQVPEGYSLSIFPSTRVRYPARGSRTAGTGVSAREVARWVEDGTNGPIRPKHARAFSLPGGWVADEVAGQAAQRPFARFRQGPGAAVQALIVRGAEDAARAMERVL